MPRNRPDVTVGCLFAAIGGFCKAFDSVGAKVLWANEKDRFATETFVANFPRVRKSHDERDFYRASRFEPDLRCGN